MNLWIAAQTQLDVPSGASVHVTSLARELARQGVRVTLLGLAGGDIDAAVERVTAPPGRLPGARLEAWMARRIATLPARALPDAVTVRVCPSTSLLPAALARRGIPTWLALHGPVLDEMRESGRGRLARGIVRHQLRRATRRARGLIAIDDALASWAAEQLGATRVHVAPAGVDLEVVKPGEREAARRRLGIDPDRALVVLVGTLGTGLRLDLLAPALSALPGVDAVVVGDGPGRAGLERSIQTAVIAGRMRAIGRRPRDEAVAWMQAANVCLDVRVGHAGTKALEYAAVGRRSVLLESPGSTRLAELYTPSIVEAVREASAAAVADALRRALARERELGPPDPAAVARARSQLGWDRAAQWLRELVAAPADTADTGRAQTLHSEFGGTPT